MSSTQKGRFKQMWITVTVDILYVTVISPVCGSLKMFIQLKPNCDDILALL